MNDVFVFNYFSYATAEMYKYQKFRSTSIIILYHLLRNRLIVIVICLGFYFVFCRYFFDVITIDQNEYYIKTFIFIFANLISGRSDTTPVRKRFH